MNAVKLQLYRERSNVAGTFGQLVLPNSNVILATGELNLHDNLHDVSCIPAGTYKGRLAWSWRFARKLYRLQVPGRDGILIHPANWMGEAKADMRCQLKGCIALGLRNEVVDGQLGLSHSREAVALFMASLAGADIELTIRDPITSSAA